MARENAQVTLDQVMKLLEARQPEKALSELEPLLEKSPEDPDALLLESEALVLLDRWEEAEEILQSTASRNPKNAGVILALADLIIDFHPDDSAALREAYEMATRVEGVIGRRKGDEELKGELRFTAARALVALGDPSRALPLFHAAREILGDVPDLLIELAMAQFEALRFEECTALLSSLAASHPEDGRVHHYLGLLAERTNDEAAAAGYFARARALDPEELSSSVRLSREEMESLVANALDSLPPRVASYMDNVQVIVEDIPSLDDLRGDPPLSPLSLGLFRGRPRIERSHLDTGAELPSTIVLYQRNLERYALSRDDLVKEVETTLLHEVGHFLGWNEDDLYARALD